MLAQAATKAITHKKTFGVSMMFGLISPPLEVPPGVLFLSHSPLSLPPQQPPGLTPISSQASTPPKSSPSAPSTQPVCQMTIPVDSTFTPLQVVPSCSPSLSSPNPAHINFAFPVSIPAILVSDLGKVLSTHTHNLWSKWEDLTASLSDTAMSHDTFMYRFQLKQYMPHLLSFVFNPGG
ncbi:hypothetical protein EDB84DRAFT_1446567 [Lactarius hengduanensis]|nr:hypothetical protein EDB84DRAFT_1446567 [Lactarius hengduanensis]